MIAQPVPEGKYVDVGEGLKIHYQEEGEGPVVLFLHGSGPGASGWSNFHRNYSFLAQNGFRAIVPDTLGFGYSSKPEDRDYTLAFLVGALGRFVDALGIKTCSIVGNSHGGAMAIQFALDHPGKIDKLVLMAPGGLEERETYMKMEGIGAMVKAVFAPGGITRTSLRQVLGLQLHDASQITDELIEERFSIAQHQPKRVLSTLYVPHLAPELHRIAAPVFGLWGMDDKFCPVSGANRIAQSCPSSRVLLISKCGHWVMVEHVDLFNRLCLDFLVNS